MNHYILQTRVSIVLLMCIALEPADSHWYNKCPSFICKRLKPRDLLPKCEFTGKCMPEGKHNVADCANCPKGTYDDEFNNGPSCKTCREGKHSKAIPPRTSCVDCEPGKISEAGQEECSLCPIGKSVMVANANRCEDCTSRRRRERGNVLEDTCPHAHFLHSARRWRAGDAQI